MRGNKMRICAVILAWMFTLSVAAQETFTQHLTRQKAGEGAVTLYQDAEIEALVNGITKPSHGTKPLQTQKTEADTTSKADTPIREHYTHRTQAVGYRIQVYAGGNSRKSKAEAHYVANLVRSQFGDVAVYTSFISPRWICRVGDYRTREEAVEQLRKMRATQKFSEASIVKSKIFLYY